VTAGLRRQRHRRGPGPHLVAQLKEEVDDAGSLPGSAGEKRMLRVAASPADQATISLGEAVTGIDDRNFALLIKSVWHASGRRQFG